MGSYTIVIHGTGAHHNKDAAGKSHHADADHLAKEFVKLLRENGHAVEVATLTHGGHESVLVAE